MRVLTSIALRIFTAVTLLTLDGASITLAQEESRNQVGLGFGGSDYHTLDTHASPLIFSRIGVAPILLFTREEENCRHYAEGAFYYAYLTTLNDNFTVDNWRARARYSYLRGLSSLPVSDEDVHLFVGGSVASYYNRSNYYYSWGSEVGTSIVTWYWSHSLDLAAQVEYTPSWDRTISGSRGGLFSALVFMPVISNVSRPQYSSSGDYNYTENTWKPKAFGKMEFFPKNFSLDAIISYRRPVSKYFAFLLTYEFYYSTYDKPSDVTAYMQNFRAGLFFRF